MKSPLLLSLFDEAERRPLTVSELTAQVRGAIESRFASVWVEGEISNFREHSSGHWYFTVKDEGSQLDAACFRGVNARIRFRPEDGLQVRARGRLTVYQPRGRYELMVEGLDPVGAGALRVAFEQLRARLAAEGLFDEGLKRPLPLLPRRVGVVTSPTGAALRDIVHAILRRTRTVNVLLAPARVQGEGAGREIAQAVAALNEHHRRALAEGRAEDAVDAIIVGRGGGSAEDLWAFNEEEVARAVRASDVPVISAVGHETDYTIADFASDVRAATPTAAAELVAAREDEVAAYVEGLTRELGRSMRLRLLDARGRVQEAAMSAGFDDVQARLREAREGVENLTRSLDFWAAGGVARARRKLDAASCRLSPVVMARRVSDERVRLAFVRAKLDASARTVLDAAHARAGLAAASLDALSPLAVLARGYSIARDARGRLVRSAHTVAPGDALSLRLAEGTLRCRVEAEEDVNRES